MSNLWSKLLYSGISKNTLDYIYYGFAREALEEELDKNRYLWMNDGSIGKEKVLEAYIAKLKTWTLVAKRHGNERYFECACEIAQDRLDKLKMRNGGK